MEGDIIQPGPADVGPPQKPRRNHQHKEPQTYDKAAGHTSFGPSIEKSPKKERKVLIAPHKHFKRFWRWWVSLDRNVRFGIIAACLLLFVVAATGWYYFIKPTSTPSIDITKHPKKVIKPITVASPLTGVQVDPSLVSRPVTGIMIENSPDARPQSGLQDAGVVYEAIAEGGITRFLALFQDATPQYIGPVRSLRPYYLDFAQAFQASIAHVGGSPEALARVRSGGYRDLDQFFNSKYYSRISARAAPHNVYTSFTKLDALNQSKHYTSSTYTSWPRKADKKLVTPTAKSINVAISSPVFYSHYDYDAASNSYARSEGGAPHKELVSANDHAGVQIRPKVVIALVMHYGIEADGQHSIYTDTGTGTAYIFQDGGVTQGTWSRASGESQVEFNDATGAPIKLDAGQTWITLVAAPNKVTYTP